MTCIDCQNLNIGINIQEKHRHCNRCGCPNIWDFKLQNPLPNSDKNGWWKEVLTGEPHWNRCDEFKKKCTEIKQTEKDTVPVGQKTLPQTGTIIYEDVSKDPNYKKPKPESKPDEEILNIVRKCAELESAIYQIALEGRKNRPNYDVNQIADRLVQIYNTRKINERLDKIILELDGRKDG